MLWWLLRRKQQAVAEEPMLREDETDPAGGSAKSNKHEESLKKIWQRAVEAGNVQAAAVCLRLGANVNWLSSGASSLPVLCHAAEHKDCAMVYMLLSSGAGLEGASVVTRRSEFVEGLVEAAKEKQRTTLRKPGLSALNAQTGEMPSSLQWGAPFALCAVVEDMQLRNASTTSLAQALEMLQGGAATCTLAGWSTAVNDIGSAAVCSTSVHAARRTAVAAMTAATGRPAAPTKLSIIAAARHAPASVALLLLCCACWTALRKCNANYSAERRSTRVLLLLANTALQLLDAIWIAVLLYAAYIEAYKLKCACLLNGCYEELHARCYLGLRPLMALLLAHSMLVCLLSCVYWLLSKLEVLVLQLAIRCNKSWLAILPIRVHATVAEYKRTRPTVFAVVAAVPRLDTTAAATVAAVFKFNDASGNSKLLRLGTMLTNMFCSSTGTLMDFSIVQTACEKGWDSAVVLRLLHAWMQSVEGTQADVIAPVVRSKDYCAVRALLCIHELCDTRADAEIQTGATDKGTRQCEGTWLASCVSALCELQTVNDSCYHIDPDTVLTAVAAARTTLDVRYWVHKRVDKMQQYKAARHAAVAAVVAAAEAAAAAVFGHRVEQTVGDAGMTTWQRSTRQSSVDDQHSADDRSSGVRSGDAMAVQQCAAVVASSSISSAMSAALLIKTAEAVARGTAASSTIATLFASAEGPRGTNQQASGQQLLVKMLQLERNALDNKYTDALATIAELHAAAKTQCSELLVSNTKLYYSKQKLRQVQCVAAELPVVEAKLVTTEAKLATVETQLAAAVAQAANCKQESNVLQLNLEQRDLLLHDSNTAMQKLEQQLCAERSQHAATKTELASMTQQIADHATTAAKLVSTESKLAAAIAQAVNVQQEKSELVQQLNRCTRDVKERDSSLLTLKQQRNSQRTALVTLREQLAAQTSQRADAVAALATVEAKLAAAVAQAANCKKEVNVMQLNLDQRDLLLHDSNTAMQKLEQQMSAEYTQHAATKTELTGMIQQAAEHAATAEKLTSAETELAAAVAQAAGVQREQRQLLRQLDRSTSDAKERENAIWKLQQQRNSQRTELVSLRERLAAQTSLRVDTEAKLTVADKKLDTVETQLCTSESQLATTAAELAAVISHLDDVWSEVTALRLL
eukprot:14667-Heterococcus_DN1.PRE.4